MIILARLRLLCGCALVGIPIIMCSSALAQSRTEVGRGNEQRVTVDSPRPLADVVKLLEERHGVIITYEDPPYVYERQLTDITDRLLRGQAGSRTIVPRGGPLSMGYSMGSGRVATEIGPVLERLVEQYSKTGYAGAFQVSRFGDIFHIVPVSRRDVSGRDVPYEAVLGTQLPLREATDEPSGQVALQQFADDLQAATGVSIVVGVVPDNLLSASRVTVLSGVVTARFQLMRILASTGRPLSWQLLYDPNGAGQFVLNVHPVHQRR